MIDAITTLKEKVVLLSPDKGNGVVLLDKADYTESLDQLFADRSKFRILAEDPTNTRFNSIKDFLRKLKKRGEIDEQEYKLMFPGNAKMGRAHGTAKVHKDFERIPPLRPIVDTIGSTHYGVGKFITKLLNPLTINDYSLKDSFEAAARISAIPDGLYDEGFTLVSFDVKSLFTNVPLQKTIDVILDRVYNQRLIQTNIKKRTLKKLIRDTCNKTAFTANGVIYEQTDGVSMGASLGPVLANIIMTELEKAVVNDLINAGTIKFYARYVDDTLLMVKPEDVDMILDRFNGFHRNLEFTVDRFDNVVPHFLDLEIHRSGISIFRKETHTAQFTHFTSFTKWGHKIAWIRSLVSRAKKLCHPSKLKPELANIRKFAAYNGFPRWVVNRVVRRTLHTGQRNQPQVEHHQEPPANQVENEQPQESPVFISLPYIGDQGEAVIKKTTKRLSKLMKKEKNVIFKVFLQTTKMAFYTSNKDRTSLLSSSCVIYEYSCPGCAHTYVGKTTNTLFNRTQQHGWSQKDSSVKKHFDNCVHWKELVAFLQIESDTSVDVKELQVQTVRDNIKVLASSQRPLNLDFREALEIKNRSPELNKGLKSCKDLALF